MNNGDIETFSIRTPTHGRVLVRRAQQPAATGVLAGFHGYMENAAILMARLAAIPRSSAWTLLSIQGLHRFYRGRAEEVVASWMTREDREDAIADNIEYAAAALDTVVTDRTRPIVCLGFSQGVAAAFRAGTRGPRRAAGIIAIGGDIPPELPADREVEFPRVLLLRGARDEWYTEAKLSADIAALERRGVAPQVHVYDGAHEWTTEVADQAASFIGYWQA
jgi:predicted esterase